MNKTIISGNIVRDPRVITPKEGAKKVAYYTVAVNERNDITVYYECTAFDYFADHAEQYYKKGTSLIVSGRVRPGKAYQNKETGEYISTLNLLVESQEFQTGGNRTEKEPDPEPYTPPTAKKAAEKPAEQEAAAKVYETAKATTFTAAAEEEDLPWN